MNKLFTGFLVLALVGCCPPKNITPEEAQAVKEQQDKLGAITYRMEGYTLTEFRLQDGTRCVTSYKGGTTCEWKVKQ